MRFRLLCIAPLAASFSAMAAGAEADRHGPAALRQAGAAAAQAPRDYRDSLNLARDLIAAGRFGEAELLLDAAARAPEADATAIAFLRGLAALGRGDYDRAAGIFNAILVARPGLLRVRLELARALFLKNSPRSDRAARRQFERVLAARPPAPVARNIRAFLGAIRSRRAWELDFSFALLPDSNINRAPSSRTVTIGGLPFLLSEDAQETSGIGAYMSLGGSYRWRLRDRLRLAWSGRALRREYGGRAFDDMTLETALGPRVLFAGGEAGAASFVSRRYYGGAPYRRSFGLRLDGNRLATPRRRVSARLELQRLFHDRDRSFDGDIYSAGLSWRFAASLVSFSSLWLNYTRQLPRAPWLRNRAPNIGAGYYRDFAKGLGIGAEVQGTDTRYDRAHPLFARERRDRTWIATLRFSLRTLNIRGFTPVLSFSHIRNRSNIGFYDYRRNLLELGVRQAF
ncbi:MAG: surface lipoprotein assembly modifier [Gammaproteobacteria bacterium]|nr:surface lipoprotein assembly modifier [Gammaproteobacteria bacterium]